MLLSAPPWLAGLVLFGAFTWPKKCLRASSSKGGVFFLVQCSFDNESNWKSIFVTQNLVLNPHRVNPENPLKNDAPKSCILLTPEVWRRSISSTGHTRFRNFLPLLGVLPSRACNLLLFNRRSWSVKFLNPSGAPSSCSVQFPFLVNYSVQLQ
jgi:hypothetical protein